LRLLDRYIFGQVLITCLGAVGFFTFVMVTANALKELLALIVSGQLSVLSAIPLLGLLIPYVIIYTLPMGMLCGILLVLGRMSAESETVAMRAAGLSLTRIAAPIYALALVGVAAAIAINLYYMPVARTKQKQELARIVRGDPLKMIQPKTFVRDFRNCIVYVHEKKGQQLRDVWIWELDNQQRVRRLVRAEAGSLALRDEDDVLVVTLNRASVEDRSGKDPEDFSESPKMLFFETTSRELPMDWLFGKSTMKRKLEWFTWGELQNELVRIETSPDPKLSEKDQRRAAMKVRITMQEKLATAFTVLSFALIAVPLGIKVSRRETSANLGVAVVLALSYYVMTIMVQWLDKAPQLRPDLLLWVPNLLFVIMAIRLQRRAERA
jgi:lipopolysaccharide export system permease protein